MGLRGLWSSVWQRRGCSGSAVEPALDAVTRAKLVQIVRLGCPRETAGKYVGLAPEQLAGALMRDDDLEREVLRAEAEAEVRHMGNVHKAASDEKNWRTSVWWLERHGLSGGDAGPIEGESGQAVQRVLEKFAEIIVAEISDAARRESLLVALMQVALEGEPAPKLLEVEASVRESAPLSESFSE